MSGPSPAALRAGLQLGVERGWLEDGLVSRAGASGELQGVGVASALWGTGKGRTHLEP